MKIQKKWSENEKKYLINNYGKISVKEMSIILGRTYVSVKSMAHILKLKFGKKYENKFLPLLKDNIDNWYWYGFITGDGCLSKNYLRITLHQKDREHLQKLSDILKCDLRN